MQIPSRRRSFLGTIPHQIPALKKPRQVSGRQVPILLRNSIVPLLVKPFIRPDECCMVGDSIKPPGLCIAVGIKRRYIGLDVQERGAIKDVHILDRQDGSLYPGELNDREADRVWPFWCPRREDPVDRGSRKGVTSSEYPWQR